MRKEMPVVRVVGMTLVVTAIPRIVLNLLGGRALLRGEPLQSNQDERAPDEAAFDAVFARRATPENIRADSN